MTTPLIRQLRRSFPESKIDYLVGNSYKTIVQNNKYLDEIIDFSDQILNRRDFVGLLRLISQICSKSYDIILVLDKHWIYSLIAYLARVPKRIGFSRDSISRTLLTHSIDRRLARHEILYYLDLLNCFGRVNYDDVRIDLHIDSSAETKVKSLIHDYVVVINSGGDNPNENSQIRKLPDDKFRKLINKLVQTSDVALVGGPNDASYYKQFIQDRVQNFAGRLSLEESAALMKYAKHIYATDSGPMHMAAAVNDNITAFFGPTNPARKAPLVKNIKSVWDDQDIYEEEYELSGRVPKAKFFTQLQI